MENENVTQSNDTFSGSNETTDTGSQEQVTDETQSNDEQVDSSQETATQEQLRKWKLKVYGEEKEYTEPEVLKLAQLGGAGQKAMEKAALLEKKQREFYGWLRSALEKDPMQVAEVITGRKFSRGTQGEQSQDFNQEEIDPRERQLAETRERLQSLEAKLESQEIEKERQAIESELTSAVSKYKELDNPFMKSYVKNEYRKVLKAGIEDLSIDDVAFYVAQEFKNQQSAKTKSVQQKFQEKQNRSPINTRPAGSTGGGDSQSGIEYARKLAGRT